MLQIASDIFIRAFLLFLSLFLKIFCWVPLVITGFYFSQTSVILFSFLLGIQMLSVLLGCPLQRGVRKARVYCIWIGILYGCFIPLKL